MTYERRKQIVSGNCPYRVHCSLIKSCPDRECSYLEQIMTGWKAGQQDTLEEIEKVLNNTQYLSDLSCKTQLYDNLVSLVEQLKKR